MHVLKDISVLFLSILAAVFIVKLGFVDWLLDSFHAPYIASFVAGIFFTSLLTISPASIVLAELGMRAAPLEVAFFGALGAVVGDLLLFHFVKDRISADIALYIEKGMRRYNLDKIHSRYGRWILPILGAAVIASPLPDELGIILIGASKMKSKHLIPVSFVMNFIGVLFVLAVGEIVVKF